MMTLGRSFAEQRYVSDVLEELLDAASTREAVRAYCRSLIRELSPALRTPLEPIADYVGGKCMGYPAIWFLERLLAQPARAIIERCRSALCVSLSTSIVDDLADRDESFGPEYLAFLYVLVGEAVHTGTRDHAVRKRLHHALDVCLNPDAPLASARTARRGNRIGAFYAMIATSAVGGLLGPSRAAVAVDATARFGEICAHLDDWMDAQRDLERGAVENVAVALLRERLAGRAPLRDDLVLHALWLDERMRLLLETRAGDAVAMLAQNGFTHASLALGAVLRRCQDSSQHM